MEWWGYAFLFLGNAAGFLYQWFREERNHRWQKESIIDLKEQIIKSGLRCSYRSSCPSRNCPVRGEEEEYEY